VDTLAADPALHQYPWLSAVRADLLLKLGRHDEAAADFRRAAALTRNEPEREGLLQRAAPRQRMMSLGRAWPA
jgi:predicted RNA polymerase sigma factor